MSGSVSGSRSSVISSSTAGAMSRLLRELGLQKYEAKFREHSLDDQDLLLGMDKAELVTNQTMYCSNSDMS